MIWALTGAFYPAVDLCAGEKERGTLETLLSSPARRSEIVLGKLATIMLFSSVTALLNLGGMVLLGWMVFAGGFGLPPRSALVWIPLALVPVTALFSALCLALAALARSTKEGQYYLMPLLLLTLPLAVVPAVTGMELNLGNSLIPVTGLVLALREALEGNTWQALVYLPPVIGVTLVSCALAIHWAVEQFNKESVLFRESERLDLRLWVLRLIYDRQPTPPAGAAVFCGVLILALQYFLGAAVASPTEFGGFVLVTLAMQLVVIVLPAVLLTALVTSSPRATLLLRLPPWRTVPAAVLLAVALQPLARGLEAAVLRLYPFPQSVQEQLARHLGVLRDAPLWQIVLLLALVPAVCEELAFRGFILSGLRQNGSKWRAIAGAAVLFGLSHPILQQSLITCLVGLAIGLLAVQTGSLLPGIAFHFTHNAITLASTSLGDLPDRWPSLGFWFRAGESGRLEFQWPAVAAGAALAAALLWWFHRLPGGASTTAPEVETEPEAA
jgi:sodium transport system permease protein